MLPRDSLDLNEGKNEVEKGKVEHLKFIVVKC